MCGGTFFSIQTIYVMKWNIWDWDAVHLCYNICDEGRILSVVESEVNHLGVHMDIRKKGEKSISKIHF